MKLFPYYPTPPSPHSHPFLFWPNILPPSYTHDCQKEHFCDTHGPKAPQECLGALGQRCHSSLVLAVPGLCPTPGSKAVCAAAQTEEIPPSKAEQKLGPPGPELCLLSQRILPRLSLRGSGNPLLAQNNSHICCCCCCSASCSYLLSQSSFCSALTTPPITASCHGMQALEKSWGLHTGGG